jgi:hypothetical protein
MPHLPSMRWNFMDQLASSSQQVRNDGGHPETTYYIYDAGGQRVRKVTERQVGPGQVPTRKTERIYLGDLETYREYDGVGSAAVRVILLVGDHLRLAVRLQGRRPQVIVKLITHEGLRHRDVRASLDQRDAPPVVQDVQRLALQRDGAAAAVVSTSRRPVR